MKKILAIVLALLVILSLTACTNPMLTSAEVHETETEPSGITKDEFVKEIDTEFKSIFGDDLLLTMYEDGIYSVVFTAEGIDDIYNYYHAIPTDISNPVKEMSKATYEAGLDNMFVLVSDVDNTELLIIYNGIDVTKEVLNEN